MNRNSIIFVLIMIISVLPGCRDNPGGVMAPELTPDDATAAALPATHHCLGYYRLMVDSDLTIKAIPLRASSWHFNLTGILNSTMGVEVVSVPDEADPANGLFVFDITLTHPFETKSQFAGFDVKGILISPGTLAVGSLLFSDADETRLENADGFTRWWNPTEFTAPGVFGYTDGILPHSPSGLLTATVNPYKMYADILGATDSLSLPAGEPLDGDRGRAVFSAGSSNTRRYYIRFPMDPGPRVVFGYAIDCSWNPPDPNPPNEVPDDFPMNANQPEAWRVTVQPTVNTLYYDSDAASGGVGGGVLRLQINVNDWQGQALGNVQDEISAVRIFAPELMGDGMDGNFLNETSTEARYSADLTGTAVPTSSGETQIICRIGSSEGNYLQGAAPAPDASISAFQVLTLDIPDPECTVDANNDWLEAVDVAGGDMIIDQVCLPNDYRDFYSFDVPIGNIAEGSFDLYCDAEPTTLGLYTSDQMLVTEEDISAGFASISVDSLDLYPDDYYLRVLTSNADQVAPYLLEVNTELVSVEPNIVDVTPGDLYIHPSWLWLRNDILYMVGRGIWTFDMSDPSNPVYLGGEIFHGFDYYDDATFSYPYCYFTYHQNAEFSKLCLIDFSDPSNPVMTPDLVTFHEEARCITMNSSHFYVAMDLSIDPNLRFYDYSSDPLSPDEVGSYLLEEQVNDLGLLDPEGPDTQLVVGINTRLQFLGVEDPSSVTDEGSVSLVGGFYVNDLDVDGNLVYVVDDDLSFGWLDIYEQTETGPISRGSEFLAGLASYIDVDYPNAYVGDQAAGLTVVDITDPDGPNMLATVPLANYTGRVSADGNYVCAIPYDGTFQTFDVTVPDSPTEISRPWSVNTAGGQLGINGDNLFILDKSSPQAFEVVDISEPADAEIISELLIPDYPSKMALGENVIAYAHVDWVRCIDVSDPMNMQLGTGEYQTDDSPDLLAIYDHYVYAMYYVSSENYLEVLDITDYNSPSYITTSHWDDSKIRDVEFYGEVMYIPTADAIRIYSLASPGYPDYISSYAVPDQVTDIEIQGNYMYIFMYLSSLLEVVDLTDPINPALVGSGLNGTTNSRYMALDGQYSYYAGNLIEDINAALIYPPGTVTSLGVVYDRAFQSSNISIVNGHLYNQTQGHGLQILDLY